MHCGASTTYKRAGERIGTISDTTLLFVSGSTAGRGVGRGGGRGGTNKGKLDSRGQSGGLLSQVKIICNHCQRHVRPNCPERHCFKCRVWGHEAVSCLCKVSTPKENGEKETKDESAVTAVDQELNSEVTAESKLEKIDGGYMTCFMTVEYENNVFSVGELPPETTLERWVADNECSQFMMPSADSMVRYREGGGVVRIADDHAMPIKGIGNLPTSFWSGKGWLQVILPNVAHVPFLGYNLLSSKRMADCGHKYVGEKKGLTLHLKNGNTLFGLSAGKLNYLSAFRHPLDSSNL